MRARVFLPQSRRHAFYLVDAGHSHIVVAVNKMHLVGYSQAVFERVWADFSEYVARLQTPDLPLHPHQRAADDNVVQKSASMPWFDGTSLLPYLETVHIASDRTLRSPVSRCSRHPAPRFSRLCGAGGFRYPPARRSGSGVVVGLRQPHQVDRLVATWNTRSRRFP
jgi:sulfate adenylyltransferase subunit 1 (EFTu-like GTPase family)